MRAVFCLCVYVREVERVQRQNTSGVEQQPVKGTHIFLLLSASACCLLGGGELMLIYRYALAACIFNNVLCRFHVTSTHLQCSSGNCYDASTNHRKTVAAFKRACHMTPCGHIKCPVIHLVYKYYFGRKK